MEIVKIFNETCSGWRRDPEHNVMMLKVQQHYATYRLRRDGHLFLNEVYDMLGFDHTREGAVMGWHSDGVGYVDFGLYELDNAAFLAQTYPNAILKFNVDGDILEFLPQEDVKVTST